MTAARCKLDDSGFATGRHLPLERWKFWFQSHIALEPSCSTRLRSQATLSHIRFRVVATVGLRSKDSSRLGITLSAKLHLRNWNFLYLYKQKFWLCLSLSLFLELFGAISNFIVAVLVTQPVNKLVVREKEGEKETPGRQSCRIMCGWSLRNAWDRRRLLSP